MTQTAAQVLMRLRVELYAGAQLFKDNDLKEFTQLIREIAMVLDIVPIRAVNPSKWTESEFAELVDSNSHVTCTGCNCEIDTDTCHCGTAMGKHSAYDGHSPVPMGCECCREVKP